MIKPIKIWEFNDAPIEFQNTSKNGGDEDWLALIPPNYEKTYIPFLESDSFGCCGIDEYPIIKGKYKNYKILIGSHA